MRRTLPVVALSFSLMACSVSNGHELTDAQVNQFVPGRSSIRDVEGQLGSPTSSAENSDGTTTLEYQWGTNTASGQSYIPVVGPFIAKSNYSGSTVTYVFGANGVLRTFKKETENRPQGMGS